MLLYCRKWKEEKTARQEVLTSSRPPPALQSTGIWPMAVASQLGSEFPGCCPPIISSKSVGFSKIHLFQMSLSQTKKEHNMRKVFHKYKELSVLLHQHKITYEVIKIKKVKSKQTKHAINKTHRYQSH